MTRKVGAVLYRNSVYVLPYSKERLEDFQWLSQEIRDSEGEASVFVSDSQDEKEDKNLRRLFDDSKKEEYRALLASVGILTSRVQQSKVTGRSSSMVRKMMNECEKLENEFISIQKTDFFGQALASECESKLRAARMAIVSMAPLRAEQPIAKTHHRDFQRKTWSTREHIHIDRVCSAWLIRRFIDRQAKFVFARETGIPKRTVPFDVAGAEFSHHGDNCTFETLLRAFEIRDPVLDSMAEIVHDIDLKDRKFGRPEASGVDMIIRSLSDSLRDDRRALEVGSILLDALYTYLSDGKKRR